MNLNREELILGAVYALIFTYWLGIMVIPIAILSSLFWAISGSSWKFNPKLLRRLGCPLLVSVTICIRYNTFIPLISVPFAFCVLSLGYGIPSTQPPDEGSTLGKFWFKISEKYANLLTRSTIYSLLAISHIPVLFVK